MPLSNTLKEKQKRLLKLLIAAGIVGVLLTLFNLLKLNENIAEYFYARGLSRAYVFIAGHLSGVFPFSVFEVFVAVCVVVLVLVLIRIIKLLCKRRYFKISVILTRVLVAVLSFACVYTVVAGGNYYRKPLPLDYYDGGQLSYAETVEIVKYFWHDYSEISEKLDYDENGKSISPYTVNQLSEVLRSEYKRLDGNGYFNKYTPPAKPAVSSFFMSYEHICGITFMPTGEAMVNYQTPHVYLAVTMAHEMAHAKGVMVERESNLLAYYILISSENDYLRYCGYMYGLYHVTELLIYYDYDGYRELYDEYAPIAAEIDRGLENDFWLSKESVINKISGFFNDLYLKMSGVKDGTGNYGDWSDVYYPPVEPVDPDEPPPEKPEPIISYSQTARMLIKLGQSKMAS